MLRLVRRNLSRWQRPSAETADKLVISFNPEQAEPNHRRYAASLIFKIGPDLESLKELACCGELRWTAKSKKIIEGQEVQSVKMCLTCCIIWRAVDPDSCTLGPRSQLKRALTRVGPILAFACVGRAAKGENGFAANVIFSKGMRHRRRIP